MHFMNRCCFQRRRGYAEAEIEAVFAKYDIDGDRGLDAEERKKMHMELAKEEVIFRCDLCGVEKPQLNYYYY